ncbi:uncharacterized protein LOC124288366 [Haliotis rubra]|uniref:uncharacterized protein LOC124288366 n=1 Tax=Haliotis rubra TaxID=36100 RepID=UPI001EE5D8D8|nr:uncharacterized protein LOC124288366 [Haliotis rubra]
MASKGAVALLVFGIIQGLLYEGKASRELHLVKAEVKKEVGVTIYTVHFNADEHPTVFWRNGPRIVIPDEQHEVNIVFVGRVGEASLRTQGQEEVVSVFLDVESMYYDVHFKQQPGRSAEVEVNVPTSGITFSHAPDVIYQYGEAVKETFSVPKQTTNYKISSVHWQLIAVDDYANPQKVNEFSDVADGGSARAPITELKHLENETSVGAQMYLATDKQDYEGLLTVLVTVESTEDASPVSAVDEGHKFFIRRADHAEPFPPGFIGFISNGLTRGRECSVGGPCAVACIAVGDGLRSMRLWVRDRSGVETEVDTTPYNVNLGYVMYSEFPVPSPSSSGVTNYVCRATSDDTSAENVVSVIFKA